MKFYDVRSVCDICHDSAAKPLRLQLFDVEWEGYSTQVELDICGNCQSKPIKALRLAAEYRYAEELRKRKEQRP